MNGPREPPLDMTGSTRVLATVTLALLLVTSGCSFLTQSETTISAADVSVTESAQSDSGYSPARDTTMNETREFSVGNETRRVVVVNHLAEYKRQVSLGPLGSGELARFTVLSTPQIEIAGRTINPVGDMSNAELAKLLQEEYDTIENVQLVENRTQTMLDQETTVSKFSAEAQTVGGQGVEVYIHITKVSHGEDFVVALAVYPQDLDGEEEQVNRLLAGVDHEAES